MATDQVNFLKEVFPNYLRFSVVLSFFNDSFFDVENYDLYSTLDDDDDDASLLLLSNRVIKN